MPRRLHALVAAACLIASTHSVGIDATRGVHLTRSTIASPDRRDGHGIAIRRVRLEPSTARESQPSVVLKFDVKNEGTARVTDIVLSISLLREAAEGSDARAVLVQPFEIRVEEALSPGYSFEYELRLRNVTADGSCVPEILIVEARRIAADVF